ncbi:hypothetical protein COOONC_03171 [Cooperia oncophora]
MYTLTVVKCLFSAERGQASATKVTRSTSEEFGKHSDSSFLCRHISSIQGRGTDRRPDLSNRGPSIATTNGSGSARRPVASLSTPATSQKNREVPRRAPSPPISSKPLKRSSRVAQRREELTSESESSPERPPRKVSAKAPAPPNKVGVMELHCRQNVSVPVGRPPTKRAAAAISTSKNRRVMSSEESDEEEPVTVPDLVSVIPRN